MALFRCSFARRIDFSWRFTAASIPMVLAFDLNGTVYRRTTKTMIAYADDCTIQAVYSFCWPAWAIKTVNSLIREGMKMEAAIRQVETHLEKDFKVGH